MKHVFLFLIVFIILNSSFAQVSVKDEPRHHNVFENNFVRILDVSIKPGDTTLYHIHSTPSVFIHFTKTKVGSNIINQPASSNVNIIGNINYDSLKTPRIHRVWNEDTSWFHVMDVEIVNPQPAVNHSSLNIKNADLLFDKPLVRGYKLRTSAGQNFNIGKSDLGLLVVSIDEVSLSLIINAKEQIRIMKPGHFIWIQPNENVVIKTLNNQQGSFALLELK
jgi:hypothetical protein